MNRLILFDVDGTLIERGDPAHVAAIDASVVGAFPDLGLSIHDIDIDGKVDRQILRELVRAGGVTDDIGPAVLASMIDAATKSYLEAWSGRTGDDDLLPGVRPLLERLAGCEAFSLGLLTGGIGRIVAAKMTRLNLGRFFPIGAFGDEVDRREDLVPLALARARREYQVPFTAEDVVVVGDTPRDVEASHAGNVACVGVATGRYSEAELIASGADAVVPDLTATDQVIDLLRSVRRKTISS